MHCLAMHVLIPLSFILFACSNTQIKKSPILEPKSETVIPELIADGFDWPVGPPDAKGYYNAQGFGKNNHLGDDWNGRDGGDSDLGDPVYVVAHGYVTFAEDYNQSWGNVIRVIHYLEDGTQVESLYGHCDEILVKKGDWIQKGTQIGTIGTAHGSYYAHLHFEIRDNIAMPIGPGYSSKTEGYLNPNQFIRANRILVRDSI